MLDNVSTENKNIKKTILYLLVSLLITVAVFFLSWLVSDWPNNGSFVALFWIASALINAIVCSVCACKLQDNLYKKILTVILSPSSWYCVLVIVFAAWFLFGDWSIQIDF